MPKPKKYRFLRLYASKKPKESTYTIEIHAEGYSVDRLHQLIQAIETTQDDDTIFDFPVLRKYTDKKLMASLDRQIKDIKSGKVKAIPWEEVKKTLRSKLSKKRVKKNAASSGRA